MRAVVEAASRVEAIPYPELPVPPVELVVLPRVDFPLRWKGWDKCALCGATENITKDHIVPLSRGGWTCASNLQPLCATCNVVKSDERVTSAAQYERILIESLGRQGRAHLLPTRRVG